MSELRTSFYIAASADTVWEVIGRRFDHIGEWATAIAASAALLQTPPQGATGGRLAVASDAIGAPFAGRVCQTGIRLVPEVTETLVAYDDSRRTLTYQGSGMPSFVSTARNTWTVTSVDERRSRVFLEAKFETHGLLGRLAGLAILAQLGRTSRHLADDLTHYVEHGTPSARKRQQLRRAHERA